MRRLFEVGLLALGLVITACSDDSQPSDSQVPDGGDGGVTCSGPCEATLVAGTPGGRGAVDGQGIAARFWVASGMALADSALYIADLGNGAVRKVETASGQVSTATGTLGTPAVRGQQKDGPIGEATFYVPFDVARKGNTLYVADWDRLRVVDLDAKTVSTIKDSSGKPFESASTIPAVVVVDDKLYLSEDNTLGMIDLATGAHSTVAGDPSSYGFTDGVGSAATFTAIRGIAAGEPDVLYLTDECVIRKVTLSTGVVETIAGKTVSGACVTGLKDGTGSEALFQMPWGIAFNGTDLYVVERVTPNTSDKLANGFGRVRKVNPQTGEVTVVSGEIPTATALVAELDGPAAKARFYQPHAIVADPNGTIYVGGHTNVRKISSGTVSTVAGHLLEDPFIQPGPVVAASDGKIYTTLDARGELVRVDRASGVAEVLHRCDRTAEPCDGPRGAVLLGDKVFIASLDGVVSYDLKTQQTAVVYRNSGGVYAGGMTTDGTNLILHCRDYNQATNQNVLLQLDPGNPAQTTTLLQTERFEGTFSITHAQGKVYVADGTTVAVVDLKTKEVSTLAGKQGETGCQAGTGDAARMTLAVSVVVLGQDLYVGDGGCHVVWKVNTADGTTSMLVGSPDNKVFQAGRAQEAGLNYPRFMAPSASGDGLLISDPADNIVVVLKPPGK